MSWLLILLSIVIKFKKSKDFKLKLVLQTSLKKQTFIIDEHFNVICDKKNNNNNSAECWVFLTIFIFFIIQRLENLYILQVLEKCFYQISLYLYWIINFCLFIDLWKTIFENNLFYAIHISTTNQLELKVKRAFYWRDKSVKTF
jgi:hypothetical protein